MLRRPASGLARVLFAALAFAFASLASAHAAGSSAATPPPGAISGALPNGVHYLIVPHASPHGDIAVRLLVHAGSLDEHDDELGFAHFVEHMGFNGTRSHPPGSVPRFFEKLGLTFGADLNAHTTPTHTVYSVDLPAGREAELPEALGLLRDYADGMLFLPDEVSREAAVVVSELRSRDNLRRRMGREAISRLYVNTSAPARDTDGNINQIAHATAAQLRAFYERNYHANRFTLTVVGSVTPADVVAKITAAFASVTPSSPTAPAPAVPPLPPVAATMPVDFLPAPDIRAAVVQLVSVHARPSDDLAGRRTALLQQVATFALNARLDNAREASGSPFGAARALESPGFSAALVQHQIEIDASPKHWPEAIGFAETELRRLREHGFLQTEIDEAATAMRAEARADVPRFESESSASVANRLERTLTAGRTWLAPSEELLEIETTLANPDATEVSAVAREMFAANSLHLLVRSPEPIEGGAATIRSTYEAGAHRTTSAPLAAMPELHFYYENFGPPSAVASRDRDDALALERLTFVNGVHLNLRPSTLEPARFRLSVSFAQNAAAVPKNRPGLADLAGCVFNAAHTGKHLANEIHRQLEARGIKRTFNVNEGTVHFAFSGPSSELPFTLRLLAALFSDLKPDPAAFRQNLGRYAGYRGAQMSDVTRRAMLQSLEYISDNDARFQLPSVEKVSEYTFKEVQQWMDTWWINGPLEIGLVGDFSPDTAITQAAATIGALPPRVTPKPVKPLPLVRSGSHHAITAPISAGTATSCVLWPLDATDEDPRANAALTIAIDILRDRLRATLREELGATYSPQAGIRRERLQRDFAFAWTINTFKPDQADRFTKQAIEIAAQLVSTGATAEEFARLREPVRARHAENLRDNGWWLNAVVSQAQTRPAALMLARAHATVVDELTLDDVNRAARIFAAPATITIVRPSKSK